MPPLAGPLCLALALDRTTLRSRPTATVISKPGVKPKKGPRQPKLTQRVTNRATAWLSQEITWYAGQKLKMDLVTGTALWHRDGEDPLPIRWVLLRDPSGKRSPFALFCTDPTVPMLQLIAWYVSRWNIEVTFEEVRAHLGLETQRQWSTLAIVRTTPCLLGLFSLVVLMAHALHPEHLPTRQAAWYPKAEPTFVDALAAVRRHLWAQRNSPIRPAALGSLNSSQPLIDMLVEVACYAA